MKENKLLAQNMLIFEDILSWSYDFTDLYQLSFSSWKFILLQC